MFVVYQTIILLLIFEFQLFFVRFILFKLNNHNQTYNLNIQKMFLRLITILIAVFVKVSLTIGQMTQTKQNHENDFKTFCWKGSYGRGVGTIPTSCGSNQDKIGLLCYQKCPTHYSRFGFDCHTQCPSGWRNDGLFCRLSEYGRGTGYGFFPCCGSQRKARNKCQGRHGSCQKWGLFYYPTCKAGYHNFGCCICRPSTPNCKSLGFRGGFDLSCAKNIKIGSPKYANCPSGKVRDAGLCYPPCKPGYNGVGPVCWEKNPTGWVDCGMGSAKSSASCGSVVSNQVISVGTVAYTVATLGTGTAATAGANTAKASKFPKLKAQLDKLIKLYKENKQAITKVTKASQSASIGYHVGQMSDQLNQITVEDIVRLSAQLAALLDPTGFSSTVAAYTYPKCHKYFG